MSLAFIKRLIIKTCPLFVWFISLIIKTLPNVCSVYKVVINYFYEVDEGAEERGWRGIKSFWLVKKEKLIFPSGREKESN